MTRIFWLLPIVAMTLSSATIYIDGTSGPCGTCVFGPHLVSGPHTSVAGVGGSGLNGPNGSALDGQRTYIYDQGAAPDLADGVANRGDAGFAMMIWDMGVALNTLRLYTHQDHYSGGPITTNFVAQDVMEYSVWGSQDGDHFVLLSDVTAFDINGGGAGLPTYTFNGTAPSVVYRGGSTEFGVLNAYTRDYTFPTAYRYFGIRASSVTIAANDADPEIDAIAANQGPISDVPEPSTLALLFAGGLAFACLRRGTVTAR